MVALVGRIEEAVFLLDEQDECDTGSKEVYKNGGLVSKEGRSVKGIAVISSVGFYLINLAAPLPLKTIFTKLLMSAKGLPAAACLW